MKIINNHSISSSLVVLLISLSVLVTASRADDFEVISPRALNDAFLLLQERLNCAITFEDAPYDVSERIQELFPGGPRIPRERTFIYEYHKGQSPLVAIQSLLDAYLKVDDRTVFSVQRDHTYENMFHVFPVKHMNRDGEWTAYSSILDQKISFTVQEEVSWASNIQNICSLLPRSGTRLEYAGDFRGGSSSPAVFTNTIARNCLAYLAHDKKRFPQGSLISWSIRRGPSVPGLDDFAVLYLSRVTSTNGETADHFMIVESLRPLSDSVSLLGDLLNCTVIYEDPQYICPCDVLSDVAGKPQIPSGGRLGFNYSSKATTLEIIAGCSQAYNEQNDAAKFLTTTLGTAIHIFPTLGKNANGNLESQNSLLNCVAPLRDISMPIADYFDQIVREISSKFNVRVVCGELPESILAKGKLFSPEVGHTVAQVLSNISTLIKKRILWTLYYDPKTAQYILSGRVY